MQSRDMKFEGGSVVSNSNLRRSAASTASGVQNKWVKTSSVEMILRWIRGNNLFVPLLVTIVIAAVFFTITLDIRYSSFQVLPSKKNHDSIET